MGLFGKGKSLQEQAMDERAKMEKQQMRVKREQLDTQLLQERRRKAEAMRRLTA